MASRAEMNHHAQMRQAAERRQRRWANDPEFRRRELAPQLEAALAECDQEFSYAVETVEQLCGATYPERVAEARTVLAAQREEKKANLRAKFERLMG